MSRRRTKLNLVVTVGHGALSFYFIVLMTGFPLLLFGFGGGVMITIESLMFSWLILTIPAMLFGLIFMAFGYKFGKGVTAFMLKVVLASVFTLSFAFFSSPFVTFILLGLDILVTAQYLSLLMTSFNYNG